MLMEKQGVILLPRSETYGVGNRQKQKERRSPNSERCFAKNNSIIVAISLLVSLAPSPQTGIIRYGIENTALVILSDPLHQCRKLQIRQESNNAGK